MCHTSHGLDEVILFGYISIISLHKHVAEASMTWCVDLDTSIAPQSAGVPQSVGELQHIGMVAVVLCEPREAMALVIVEFENRHFSHLAKFIHRLGCQEWPQLMEVADENASLDVLIRHGAQSSWNLDP